MAQPVTIKGGKVAVLLGDGADPEVFSNPCGFTDRSLSFSKGLEEVNIPDCDNPDAVDWIGRDATSLSMSISGDGVLASESVETWLNAWEDVESVNVKVVITYPAKTITWTGAIHVESMEIGANNGQRVTSSISMQSDGIMTRVVT